MCRVGHVSGISFVLLRSNLCRSNIVRWNGDMRRHNNMRRWSDLCRLLVLPGVCHLYRDGDVPQWCYLFGPDLMCGDRDL